MWVLSQRLPLGLFVYHVCLLFLWHCSLLCSIDFHLHYFFQFPCVHLSGCSVSIQSWLHFSMVVMSCCSISWSFVFIMDLNILISSENRNVSDWVRFGKSFMYNTKSRGPMTVPCGIPDVTSCQFDSFPFTATFCLLYEMKASIQFTISLLIFRLFNLLISLLRRHSLR